MAEMGLYEAMRTLRAVRRLRPDPIPDDVLHRVLEAATWAPSGGNRQPWRIIVVKEAERKRRLGELYAAQWYEYVKRYTNMPSDTPQNVRERTGRTVRAGNYLAEHFHDAPVIAVFCFDPSVLAVTDAKLNRTSIVGGGSVYPAVQNLLLACRAEGLGCVLTTLMCASESEVKEVLSIPPTWGTAAAIPIGYPVLRGHGPITRKPISEMAFLDSWDKPLP